jgi:hypothetical protein
MISMQYDGIYRFKDNQKVEDEFEAVFLYGKEPDFSLLTNPEWVEKVAATNSFKVKNFENKFACAQALAESFGGRSKVATHRTDKHVWMWLTYALYDEIVKVQPDGTKKFLRYDNYYPAPLSDFQTAARHRIRTLAFLYSKHKDEADFILSTELDKGGELLEQVTQTAAFSDTGLFKIFRKLYWNEHNKSLKRGHGSKDDLACRGLVGELKQIMVTYAPELMTIDEAVDLLDPRFKSKWL